MGVGFTSGADVQVVEGNALRMSEIGRKRLIVEVRDISACPFMKRSQAGVLIERRLVSVQTTLLVFLAAATRAWVVSSDFGCTG